MLLCSPVTRELNVAAAAPIDGFTQTHITGQVKPQRSRQPAATMGPTRTGHLSDMRGASLKTLGMMVAHAMTRGELHWEPRQIKTLSTATDTSAVSQA